MTRLWALAALLMASGLVVLAGCSSLPPRQPAHVTQTALFLTFKTEGMVFSWADDATSAAVAPVRKDGTLDLDRSIFSNYRREDRVYFLDLPPGRYALAAVYWTKHGLRHAVRLSYGDEKEAPGVDAKAGDFRFLGSYTAKRRWQSWPRFLLNGLLSGKILIPPFLPAVSFLDAPVSIHDDTVLAESRALRAALADLAKTEWTTALRARLASLKVAPELPSQTEGFFRRREVAAKIHWTPRFGWVDTLEWGEPRSLPGGLEWRHPDKEARIQVELRSSPPLSRALESLKGLGSSEDSHVHRDVLISTRPAHAVRYTTYHYPEPYLTGSVVKVAVTETLLVPAAGGYWVVQMRAARGDFSKLLPAFVKFRDLLRLDPPPKEDK